MPPSPPVNLPTSSHAKAGPNGEDERDRAFLAGVTHTQVGQPTVGRGCSGFAAPRDSLA